MRLNLYKMLKLKQIKLKKLDCKEYNLETRETKYRFSYNVKEQQIIYNYLKDKLNYLRSLPS